MSTVRARFWFLIPLVVLLTACSNDPKVVCKKYVDKGNKYFDRGMYKQASLMYRRALKKDMRWGDAWYHLGLTDMKLGNPAEARRDFSRSMEIDKNNADAIVKLGEIDLFYYLADTQGNKALLGDLNELTQLLLKKDAKSFDGLRFSGYIDLMNKNLKGAIDKFEAANQIKPYQPELILSLVQALYAAQAEDQAEKFARDLIAHQKSYGPMYDALYVHYVRTNHPDQAEALLKEKVANNPSQGAYLLQLAFHYYLTNHKDQMKATLDRLNADRKTFPDNHMQVGDFYLRIRDFPSALQQYDQGQSEDSKNKRAYQKKMVEVLGTQGKNDQASKIVAALLKDDPKDPEALAMHATLLLQTGDRRQLKTVIAELQPLVSKMPGNATLHYNLGRAYMGTGDAQSLDQARVEFLAALKAEPKYMPAKVALAQLELERGEKGKAVQMAEQVLAVEPTNLLARLIRANGLFQMGEYPKTREELNVTLKLYPKSNDARFQLGQLDYAEKRYKDAETDFEALMQANDPRGLRGIVESKIGQGQWEQAIQFATQQVQKSPDRDDYRMALAKIYFRAGKYADAVGQFDKLIEKNPKTSDLYVQLGEAKKFSRDYNGAIASFQKAKDLDPSSAIPPLELAMIYDENLGRYDDARKSYEDALKLQPDNATALNNLAFLKADNNVDLDQALVYAQRAQQKMPTNLDVMDTLALIYIRKNLTDDGLRMLRDLVVQRPNSPTFHLHLALALYQKGDRLQAKKELEAALRNKPSEKEQDKIKQLLPKVG
jgi:tetratricopeptide (TPR) repeat protein